MKFKIYKSQTQRGILTRISGGAIRKGDKVKLFDTFIQFQSRK